METGKVKHTTLDHDRVDLALRGIGTFNDPPMPQQEYLMWWLESFDESDVAKMTIAAGEVTAWESLVDANGTGGNDVFTPSTITSGIPPSSSLQPLHDTDNLVSEIIDSDVALFKLVDLAGTNRPRNVRALLYSSFAGFETGTANDGITFVCVFKVDSNLPSLPLYQTLACMHGQSTDTGYNRSKHWDVQIVYTATAYQVRFRRTNSGDNGSWTAYAPVAVDNLSSAGWVILVAVLDPKTNIYDAEFKLYIGRQDTGSIDEYDPALFTNTFMVSDFGDSMLATYSTIGAYNNDIPYFYLLYSAEALQATNVSWRKKLTDAEVKQVFAYYKHKYPNIFTYDAWNW